MQKILIISGLILLILGLLWPVITKMGFGQLPGDISVKTDGFSFYFPIVTCAVISLVMSLIFWLFNR